MITYLFMSAPIALLKMIEWLRYPYKDTSEAEVADLRSPYYALAYGLNDIVLIVLWIIASMQSVSYIPMAVCFVMFFFNDIYGFYN